MTYRFRNPALDPARWTGDREWTLEARDTALVRTAPLGQRFFGGLFDAYPGLDRDSVFLRSSVQPQDTYLFVDRLGDGFGVQFDPDLEYIIVSGADGNNELGHWFPGTVTAAMEYISRVYLGDPSSWEAVDV
jgi:hypothetical protein